MQSSLHRSFCCIPFGSCTMWHLMHFFWNQTLSASLLKIWWETCTTYQATCPYVALRKSCFLYIKQNNCMTTYKAGPCQKIYQRLLRRDGFIWGQYSRVIKVYIWNQTPWVQIPTTLLNSNRTLEKYLNISASEFSSL